LAFTVAVTAMASICTSSGALAARGDCAQPLTDGAGPAATDCLYILKAVVGTQTCSPTCICAPTGSDVPHASDALLCLLAAVGQPVTLECACNATTTTMPVPVTTTVPGICDAPIDQCFDTRGPNGKDFRDSDGCSADAVIDVLGQLGVTPDDPEAVKDDPVGYFTGNVCSAPFGNDGDWTNPRACELHDLCYTICGQERATCDFEFATRMQETCLSTYALGPCRDACMTVAAVYATYIATGDDTAYLNDQGITCTCCPDTAACGDGTCDPSIGEGSANCPDDCREAAADGAPCFVHEDCANGYCNYEGQCGLSGCGDGFCGAGEACGDTRFCSQDCPGCPNGTPCAFNQDCASGLCEITCVAAGSFGPGHACINDLACSSGDCVPGPGFCAGSCGDGVCVTVPDGETCYSASCQQDCGACPLGTPCTIDADCASGNCLALVCAPPPSCGDGTCNALELCGGSNSGLECNQDCGKCPNGTPCVSSSDCASGYCAVVCANPPPSCGDGSCNGTELCGGSNTGLECNRDCGKCPNGTLCTADSQCSSGRCDLTCKACLGSGSACDENSDCCGSRTCDFMGFDGFRCN